MIKEIELSIPTDWSGITLKKYLVLQQDLKSYEDDEDGEYSFDSPNPYQPPQPQIAESTKRSGFDFI